MIIPAPSLQELSPTAVRVRATVTNIAPPTVAIALLLVFWEAAVRVFQIPAYVLPAPSTVADTLFQLLSAGWIESKHVGEPPSGILRDSYVTIAEAIVGLAAGAVIGVSLGTLMAHSRFAEQSIYPVVTAIRATPIIAIAPIFIIWFGVGIAPKAVVAALATFFPMLVNSLTGMRSIDPNALELFRSVRASTAEIFWKLRVPNTLPYFFAALRLSLSLSLIGATVGELLGSREGLGHMIIATVVQLRLTDVFSGVFMLAIMGIILTSLLGALQSRVLYWHESERLH